MNIMLDGENTNRFSSASFPATSLFRRIRNKL
jgi:hypothetical protein